MVLFDQFDAIGRLRDDPTEHGEIKRVVNAFLQMLDQYQGPSTLVAATNHEGLLDKALWRRFDDVVEFRKPTVHQYDNSCAFALPAFRQVGKTLRKRHQGFKGSPMPQWSLPSGTRIAPSFSRARMKSPLRISRRQSTGRASDHGRRNPLWIILSFLNLLLSLTVDKVPHLEQASRVNLRRMAVHFTVA